MPNMVQLIKEASRAQQEAAKPTAILYGTVSSLNPLSVRVDDKLTITESFLVVPDAFGTVTGTAQLSFTVTTSQGSEQVNTTASVSIDNAIKVNDAVALLRVQGGQQFVIIGRLS